jgi:outer membrane receptor protein involved in Fe transport
MSPPKNCTAGLKNLLRTGRGLMRVTVIACAVCMTIVGLSMADDVRASIKQPTNIPAQLLGPALASLAKNRDFQIVYVSEDLGDRSTAGAVGEYTPVEALEQLLRGTGLTYKFLDERTVTIVPPEHAAGAKPLAQTRGEPQEDRFRLAQTTAGPAQSTASVALQEPQTLQRPPLDLQEIIVTATRRPERLQNVPMSITALSGVELAKRGDTNIDDIVGSTPGLYNPAQGLGSANNLIIRGVATGATATNTQTTVSFLLDDIDLNPGAATFGNANPRIVDVQRVEVLRGPQGTLFGAGSLSGAVRFISNKPDLDAFSGSLEATGSATDHGSGSGEVTGIFNAPIVQGKLAARVVAYSFNDAGWVDGASRDRTNVNGSHTDGVRVSLNAQPTDELSVLFTALDEWTHELGSSGTFYYAQPGLPDYQYQQPQYAIASSLTRTHVYNLLATWQPAWGTVTSTTNYYARPLIQTQDLGPLLTLLGITSPSDNPTAPSVSHNTIHDISQELRYESPQLGPWRLTGGAFYQRVASDPGQDITSSFDFAPVLLSGTGTTVQWQAALFGSATYTFAERFDLTAGVRFSKDVVHFTTLESGLLAGANTVGNEVDEPVTPRAALTFRQTNDLTWYVQAAKGYRVGGPNATAGEEAALASYRPDSLWNYEVGNKVRLLAGELTLNTSVYDIEWSNIQVGLVTPEGFNYIGNGGKARIYGLEEELTLRPSSWLELGGTVSVDHAATTSAAAISRVSFGAAGPAPDFEPNAATRNGVLAGYRLPGSPELQGSLYGEAQFHVLGRESYLRVSGQYIGSAYTDFDSQGLKFGDFFTANARAGVKLEHFEIVGFVDNLTNRNGIASATDLSQFNVATAYRIRPRTVGLTLRAHF